LDATAPRSLDGLPRLALQAAGSTAVVPSPGFGAVTGVVESPLESVAYPPPTTAIAAATPIATTTTCLRFMLLPPGCQI
jgi:hypothetical protein